MRSQSSKTIFNQRQSLSIYNWSTVIQQSIDKITGAGEDEISIWVDNYDDVFSDFDSRPYDSREFSDDFLEQVRRMARENATGRQVTLKFHLMPDLRDEYTEMIITDNLQAHFKRFAQRIRNDMNHILRKGIILSIVGATFGLLLGFLESKHGSNSYMDSFNVFVQPLFWFMFLTGLDYIFKYSREEKPFLDFNVKMGNANIAFSSFAVVTNGENGGVITKKKKAIPCGNNLRMAS